MKPTCLLHTWRPHRRRLFALVLHLHQHQSSRNLHLQHLSKNQSTQRCQSHITQGSDHPPVLKPHMILTGPRNGLGRPAWADRPGPISAQSAASFVWRRFPSLLDPSPFCMWALVVNFSPSWTKLLVPQDLALFRLGPWSLSSSRLRSLGFLESCLLHCMTCTGLQGVVKVLDELIPKVLLSTLKPCINTKLQN
jgi:hypothetical protein